MTQFDVHETLGDAARLAPYLIVLQTDFVSALNTVIVAPVRPAETHGPVMRKIHVAADFRGAPYIVAPEQLVSLPRSVLGTRAGSLAHMRQELMAAVDFLFLGY